MTSETPPSPSPGSVPLARAPRASVPRKRGYTQGRVKALVRYWTPKLRLHDWKVRTVFDPTYSGRAACEASPEYKEAILTFNLARCGEAEEDLEACVVHELAHCHVWALAAIAELQPDLEQSRKAEEALTTELELLMLHNIPRLYPLPTTP